MKKYILINLERDKTMFFIRGTMENCRSSILRCKFHRHDNVSKTVTKLLRR